MKYIIPATVHPSHKAWMDWSLRTEGVRTTFKNLLKYAYSVSYDFYNQALPHPDPKNPGAYGHHLHHYLRELKYLLKHKAKELDKKDIDSAKQIMGWVENHDYEALPKKSRVTIKKQTSAGGKTTMAKSSKNTRYVSRVSRGIYRYERLTKSEAKSKKRLMVRKKTKKKATR